MPFKYEQLKDMASYLKPGNHATTTINKPGYYHQALRPSLWTLLGFQWQGSYYVFTHMAFGIGPACKAYTFPNCKIKISKTSLRRNVAQFRWIINGVHRGPLTHIARMCVNPSQACFGPQTIG